MSKKRKWVFLCSLCILVSIVYFYTMDRQQFKAMQNLTYGHQDQTLDMYIPRNTDHKLPVILYVHGGGWSGGNKKNVAAKPAFFTKNGYAFLSISHRFHPESSYQDMVQDVVSAIQWVFENADTYKLDKDKVNLMGHSSGGHLIMLTGTNPVYLQQAGLPVHAIHSLVALDAPVDLESFIERLPKYKKVFGDDSKVWGEASPITYTDQQLPPSFLVTRKDTLSSLQFVEKARENGNEIGVYEFESLSHSDATRLLGAYSVEEEAKAMTTAVLSFLNTYNK